jgi:HicA toxin of bacterial toxin-antitoxin,
MIFYAISGWDLIKKVSDIFSYVLWESQKSSHIKLRHPKGQHIIIPNHRELKNGTFDTILSDIGLQEGISKKMVYEKLFLKSN